MKKGFTLIELLAVIIILAVIALIATPVVLNVIDNAKMNAAKSTAYGYIDAVKLSFTEGMLDETRKPNVGADGILELGEDNDELNKIIVSGTTPEYIFLKIQNNYVESASFCIDGYNIDYKNNEMKESETDYCKFATVKSMTLNTESSNLAAGKTLQIDYVIEPADVVPSFISSNENVATVDSNGLITAKAEGEAVITIKAGLLSKKITITVANESLIGYVSRKTLTNDSYETITLNTNGESVTYNAHVYSFTGDTVWSQNQIFGDANDVATETEYAKNMIIVKVDGNLTINEGVTVTTYNTEYGGPKGLFIYVTGTLTNNGTISMTARGAKAEGQNVYLWQNADRTYEYVPAVGAAGAAAATGASGVAGSNATGRATGGGGKGSAYTSTYELFGGGSAGTSYSGGSGGGGTYGNSLSDSNTIAKENGGAGGAGGVSGDRGSSGAGNPAGQSNVIVGENGTGGLLVIYADTIVSEGIIESNGSAGGAAKVGDCKGAGGGSGAGSINIFYKNTCTINSDNIYVTGGAGGYGKGSGSTAVSGGDGGAGSKTIGSIKTGTFVAD